MTDWEQNFSDAIANATSAGDKEDLLHILTDCINPYDVVTYMRDNPNVFHELCKDTFLDVVHCLVEYGVDVNLEWAGFSPLQVAAAAGDVKVVTFLLSKDASMSRDVWQETSPFYLASLYGHYDIVVQLTDAFPSYVKDPENRNSLFYAACKGGNLSIVQFWYLPGMDLSTPVQLISSFENCENMVPLFAACEGNHMDVAEFLLDSQAIITDNICQRFPQMTAELMSGCFKTGKGQTFSASMSHQHLARVHPLWFEPHLTHLTEVDLSDNRLKTLPLEIPWSMPHIKVLNVCKNRLKDFSGPSSDDGTCLNLETVNLSNNELEEVCVELFCIGTLKYLDLSNNRLEYLIKPTHVQPELHWSRTPKPSSPVESEGLGAHIGLPCLTQLNLSHNKLKKIPEELRLSGALTNLDASDNELYSFISAWSCPLHYLNLSDNCLERFPVSVEEFWSGSLAMLDLQNNNLEELGESIVKLSELRSLNVSNNRIDHLPEPSVWDCRYLETLNLANNYLGTAYTQDEMNKTSATSPKTLKNYLRRWSGIDQPTSKQLVFPEILSFNLKYLILRNNNLIHAPVSVSQLQNLITLDLSQNQMMKTLPLELGLLKQCQDLLLAGNKITDPPIPPDLLSDTKTTELIDYLRQLLRKSEPNNRLKLVVLGPQDKGKTTLLSLLQGTAGHQHGDKINTTEWKLTAKGVYQMLLPSSKPDIKFNVWELPGNPDLTIIHQCFLTQNTLYLLVFDLRKDYQHLQEWLCQIQANAHKATVILVGTFYDKLDPVTRNIKVQDLAGNIVRTFTRTAVKEHYPLLSQFKVVSCATKEGVDELRKIIYETGIKMAHAQRSHECLIGMKIPQSYRLLVDLVRKKRKELEKMKMPPYLTEEGFQNLLDELPYNDILVLDDTSNALKYLLEAGSLLHFNEQLQGLNCLYFLDPVWLQELLALIAIDTNRISTTAKIPVTQLYQRFKEKMFPDDLFLQYIQLLKRSEIVVETDDGKNLLVPYKLPKEKPIITADITQSAGSRKIYRLYKLTYIPARLWSRFIIRLLKATERFSQTPWFLNTQKAAERSKRLSSELKHRGSSRGFVIKNKDITYWREGIRVASPEAGYFLIESVNYRKPPPEDLGVGILITIVAPSSRGLSAMGIIVDELDDILRDYFPGFQDFLDELPSVLTVCPYCYDPVKDDAGIVVNMTHFDVQTCALTTLNQGEIVCPQGKRVQLEDLVPEMFFKELPKKFFLDNSLMKMSNNPLGTGAAGAVFRGRYKDIDVAIKMFHCSIAAKSPQSSLDSGSASMSTEGSQDAGVYGNVTQERSSVEEANSLKAYKAFSEFRKEVAVLSKLQHPCIVSFLGLSLQPYLYITMELAELGSLRHVLDMEVAKLHFNKFQDKNKTYPSILSKDITYKIIYQVAKGLEYLHQHSITYRDLKSDNVLICSLDVTDTHNVKLSDYGISKFATSQGLSGFVGTPGYMAPEIMNRQIYTEKVDIFSFSMVIYEVLSGRLPYDEYVNLSQIMQAVIKDRKRPNLKNFNIVSHFPYLEYLMSECWNHDASRRPSAREITAFMRLHQLVGQCDLLTQTGPGAKFKDVTCTAVTSETRSADTKAKLWIWEAADEEQVRCYSIFNLDTSSFHVARKECPGADVRCMIKAGRSMFVGTEASAIELFGCGSIGVPKCQEQFSLTAIPTSMIFHKMTDNEEESMGHVFVGLDNGSVVIYAHQPNMRKTSKTWRQLKTLTLSTDQSVCSMTLVSEGRELWVACGHMMVIVSTQTLLKEEEIDIKQESMSSKLAKNPVIQQLVSNENKVWCSFRKSSKVFEYDAELRQLLFCLDVQNSDVKYKYLAGSKDTESNTESDFGSDDDEFHATNLASKPSNLSTSCQSVSLVDLRPAAPTPSASELTNPSQNVYDEVDQEQPVTMKHRSLEPHDYLTLLPDRHVVDEANEDEDSDLYEYIESPGIVTDKTTSRKLTLSEASHVPPKPSTLCTSDSGNKSLSDSVPVRPPRNKNKTMSIRAEPTKNRETNPPLHPRGPRSVSMSAGETSPPPRPPRLSTRSLEETQQPVLPPRKSISTEYISNKASDKGERSKCIKGMSGDDNAPPVPPRRLTLTVPCPPDVPTRSAFISPRQSRKLDLDSNVSPDKPPAIPPRSPTAKKTSASSPDLQHHSTGRNEASSSLSTKYNTIPANFKSRKSPVTLVSSMQVIHDTLWVGTSNGKILIIGINKNLPNNGRPKLSVLENVSTPRLEDGQIKRGPVYMMTAAGNMVVSSVRVNPKQESLQTELTVWEAMGRTRLDDITNFWNSISKEERELTNKDSLAS
ncbi:leucine-rich repeat serine/threonine-protein kinase 1-like isoform X1 [Haliotis asinina]|uniref:leucine-rich repeat serine/threonine-protein kinase 1-like isoform X1 n=2 Tax=Haliotis asinina TaxID=109174 RepID=UPI0035320BDA